MELFKVQLDFSAAFDRGSYSGLLFKLKSIGVGDSVLSICTEFLSIPIISGVPRGSVLGPLLFILYTSEMFENRLFAYADDSTLLVVVRKPADRPAVAVSLYRDLAKIQKWCNHWFMILNPNKFKALVVSRSRTVNPLHGEFVLSGVSIQASPNLDILGVKFDSKLTFEDYVRVIV